MFKRIWSLRQEVVGAAAQWSGAGRIFELTSATEGALVLMYHSIGDGQASAFVDPPNWLPVDTFERQMAFLSQHRRVVSLTEMVAQIQSGTSPASGTVCITFDDGYLDNLTVAAPILQRYALPATLFMATGYIGRGESQWADVLFSTLQRRTCDRLSLALPGLEAVDLGSPGGMQAARRALHRHLLEATYAARCEILASVDAQLAPQGTAPRLTMNWDEARRLRDQFPLFEFGGHTRDHIDLRTHQGADALAEIDGCATDIRRELGIAPKHFSFPYGRWSAPTREIVVQAGWASSVGAGTEMRIGARSDRYAIPRIDAPRRMTNFRFKTSGAYPGLLSALGMQ